MTELEKLQEENQKLRGLMAEAILQLRRANSMVQRLQELRIKLAMALAASKKEGFLALNRGDTEE
jgi:hypothetical protein